MMDCGQLLQIDSSVLSEQVDAAPADLGSRDE